MPLHLLPGKETPLFTLPLRKQEVEASQWGDCPGSPDTTWGRTPRPSGELCQAGSWAKLWSMYSNHSVKLSTVEHVTRFKKQKSSKKERNSLNLLKREGVPRREKSCWAESAECLFHTRRLMTRISIKVEERERKKKEVFKDRQIYTRMLASSWFWVLAEAIYCCWACFSSILPLRMAVRMKQNHVCVVPTKCLKHN